MARQVPPQQQSQTPSGPVQMPGGPGMSNHPVPGQSGVLTDEQKKKKKKKKKYSALIPLL